MTKKAHTLRPAHPQWLLALVLATMATACGGGGDGVGDGDSAQEQTAAPEPDREAPPATAEPDAEASPAPAVGVTRCADLRPGAVIFVGPSLCTANFLYRDGAGAEYLGTAGHCVLGSATLSGEDAGERVWTAGTGPEVSDAGGAVIGHIAYAVLTPPKDFALIRLANGVAAAPAMCHFGGPTGINDETSAEPSVLRFYGNGLVTGDVLPARSALALSMADPDEVFLTSVAAPGDSGAGVIDAQGRAVGVLVTVGLHNGGAGTNGVELGTVGVTRLTPQLERARQALNRPGLSLVTAP